MAQVNLTSTNTKLTLRASLEEFVVLKVFNVQNHPPRALTILIPPSFYMIKYNNDGAHSSNPSVADCGEIFRDNNGLSISTFA